MKKLVIALVFSTTLFAQGAFAQIPTTDVASITAQAMQMLQQMNQLIDQYQSLREQIDNQREQISAMTGGRGMAGAVGYNDYNKIPTNWKETLDQMNGGSYSSQTKDILETMNGIDPDAFNRLDSAYQEQFSKSSNQAATYQALQGKQYNDTAARFAKLKDLIKKIDDTEDVKAAIDLNTRIQGELAMLMNERNKMQALAGLNQAQQQLEQSKIDQMRSGHGKETNMDFSQIGE